MEEREQTKLALILALIPSTAYTNLQPGAKHNLTNVVDMFLDYVYAPPAKAPAKAKVTKSKKEITEKSPSTK